MKKFLQTLAFIYALQSAVVTVSSAQTILGITMIPANPTNNDYITFLANCMFPSGNCDPYIVNLSLSGNYFYASALHCLGVLSFICNYTDTFIIPPQAAGNYNFAFHLESGNGPSCTPGIVAGPTDTLSFVVSSSTGISELMRALNFTLTPNPSTGKITIEINNSSKNTLPADLELFNFSGEKLATYQLHEKLTDLNIALPSGVYLCRIKNSPNTFKKLVIIN